VEVLSTRPQLTLRNNSAFRVGYLVTDAEMMTIALFPPTGPDGPTLERGESIVLPYAAIDGYTEGTTHALVSWWTYVLGADGVLTADGSMESLRVALGATP